MTLRILAMVEIICYNAVRQNVKGKSMMTPPLSSTCLGVVAFLVYHMIQTKTSRVYLHSMIFSSVISTKFPA